MAIDRTTIIAGPAIITFKGVTLYTEGDIELSPGISYGEIKTAMHGKVDAFIDDIVSQIKFTPAGQWITAHLAVLWPHTNPVIGSSLFGATDSNVTIQTLAGQLITWKTGAISDMPDIILSAVKPAIGAVTIDCIGANNTAWSDAAKRAVVATQAFADTSFAPADIKMAAYTGVITGGSAPWDAIRAQDGWTISFKVDKEPVKTDADGTVDMRIAGVTATAKCIPVGISETQLLAKLPLQGAGIVRGKRLSGLGANLTIAGPTSGDPSVVLINAVMTDGAMKFGSTALRVGEIAFESCVTFTAGARNALFSVGTKA